MDDQKPEVQYKIGIVASLLLVYLGINLDALELALDLIGTAGFGVLVVIGYIKDFITIIILTLIFAVLGAPFWKGRKAKKKMVTMISAFIISFIPWVGGVMPETTISIITTILFTCSEDRENAKEMSEKKREGVTRSKRIREKRR